MIDGLRAMGWGTHAAYQGAIGFHTLFVLASYLHLLRAKTP
jgi:hypothetical protein